MGAGFVAGAAAPAYRVGQVQEMQFAAAAGGLASWRSQARLARVLAGKSSTTDSPVSTSAATCAPMAPRVAAQRVVRHLADLARIQRRQPGILADQQRAGLRGQPGRQGGFAGADLAAQEVQQRREKGWVDGRDCIGLPGKEPAGGPTNLPVAG